MTYTDTTVLKNTRYYYRVRAFNTINTIGNSAWSNTATVMTPGQLPTAPTGLATGAVTSTSVVLNWTALVGDQTGFVIQSATNAGFTTGLGRVTVNTPALTTYTRTGLRRNTLYYFRVAARNAAGTGPYSNVVSATTLP
jgi:phosphodiesterase/alkaline phosphatase D-like protein